MEENHKNFDEKKFTPAISFVDEDMIKHQKKKKQI